MDSLPRVPGYVLLKPLGGGPITQVFAARDAARDEPCAIKLVRADYEDQTTAIKLLQREARAGLAVRHPHLVEVRYARVTRPPYFLVMEQLRGESLRARLRRQYKLDVPTGAWIGRQVAEALAALHRAGFLHGDVKPENVHLEVDGRAVLLDLGFAHRPGENTAIVGAGYVMGTANYLAPELCRDAEEFGVAGDLFSLGVMLYEMLTGRLPYPVGSIDQTLRRHAIDPPADIARHLPLLPPLLAKVVDRLLARKPEDRPTAAKVVRQLIDLEITGLGRRRAG